QRVNLSEVAGQVAAELARRQPSRQVRLDVQPGLSAEVDPHLLTIVLENLMGNACKFTGKKAEAHVEVGQRADGPEPAFYVEDNRDDVELTVMALKESKITNPVVIARNGVEALDYLFGTGSHAGRDPSVQPVVVLLDIKLPLLSGLDVLRRMRDDERTKRTP